MKIEKNKVVAVTYDLTVEGNIVDRATEEAPLDYIQGMHMLIPAFEAALEGLQEGDAFAFTLQPEEGYGSFDEKKLIHLPKSAFTIQGEVREDLMQVGRILPMVGADGSIVNATVTEVKEDGVLMDFNHPMAGKVLDFSGKVVSVREATEKELTEGLHGNSSRRRSITAATARARGTAIITTTMARANAADTGTAMTKSR